MVKPFTGGLVQQVEVIVIPVSFSIIIFLVAFIATTYETLSKETESRKSPYFC